MGSETGVVGGMGAQRDAAHERGPGPPVVPSLTAKEARAALTAWVKSTWFASRAFAAEVALSDQSAPCVHHVRLRTFTETRVVVEAERPFRGETLGPTEEVLLPDAWSIALPRPAPFCDDVCEVEISGTGRAVPCEQCGSMGKSACRDCAGTGEVEGSTLTQGSDGTVATETVQQTCGRCKGTCWVTCSGCEGSRQVVRFARLTCRWATHDADKVAGLDGLPEYLVANAAEQEVVTEEADSVEPRAGDQAGPYRDGQAPRVNASVNVSTNALIDSHTFGADTRIVRQRLSVRAIPVFRFAYDWRGAPRTLWIYGADRTVYAPGFPLSTRRLGIVAAFWAIACALPTTWWLLAS